MSGGTYADEDVEEINQFLYNVLRMITRWIAKVRKVQAKCFPQIKQESDLYLIDEDIALVQCVSELMGILHRLFNGCHRWLKYYVYHDCNTVPVKKTITKDFSSIDFLEKRVPKDQEYDVDYFQQ